MHADARPGVPLSPIILFREYTYVTAKGTYVVGIPWYALDRTNRESVVEVKYYERHSSSLLHLEEQVVAFTSQGEVSQC